MRGLFNIGSSLRISTNRLHTLLHAANDIEFDVLQRPQRPGDVRDNLADIDAAKSVIELTPAVPIVEGLVK